MDLKGQVRIQKRTVPIWNCTLLFSAQRTFLQDSFERSIARGKMGQLSRQKLGLIAFKQLQLFWVRLCVENSGLWETFCRGLDESQRFRMPKSRLLSLLRSAGQSAYHWVLGCVCTLFLYKCQGRFYRWDSSIHKISPLQSPIKKTLLFLEEPLPSGH